MTREKEENSSVPVPKGSPACVSEATSLVPVGCSNRFHRVPKAPDEIPSFLDPDNWSRFPSTS